MSKKQPRPFFVAARGVWRVQFNGRQHSLGPDEAEAWKKYHEMMARPPEVVAELVVGVILDPPRTSRSRPKSTKTTGIHARCAVMLRRG